jgi:hypothetical protein
MIIHDTFVGGEKKERKGQNIVKAASCARYQARERESEKKKKR